jgi:hypothetical protein
MRYEPEIQSASIVLLGRFNPAIFSPAWFAKIGVLSEEELETTILKVNHPEITQFSLERLAVEVFPDRFVISTPSEPFVRILDDVLMTFHQLPHSPVRVFGINYEIHFKLASPKQRVALGRALAPLQPWSDFGKRMGENEDDPNRTGGLVTLVMQESGPPDREIGFRQVRVERSQVGRGNSGVRMHINDHFEVPNLKDEEGAHPALNLLRQRFDESLNEAKNIVTQMMNFAAELSQ